MVYSQQPLPIQHNQGNGGMNQMFDIIKMQYIMKMFDNGAAGSHTSLVSFLVLMAYDNLIKYFPQVLAFLATWFSTMLYGAKETQQASAKEFPALLPTTPPPPSTKSIKAFIQFERSINKAADPQIDAVLHHVCTMPDVRSLRYNGVEMIPNFKETLMIENDIWFEILQSASSNSTTIGQAHENKPEPIIYRLSTYDHDITWLHRFVEQAMDRFEQEKRNKLGSEIYYFDQIVMKSQYSYNSAISCMFTKSKFQSNRTLDNVYLPKIEELKERVDFFMHRRDWYDMKGIPHTLGIVMYGHPGCGKTSTIKAIANDTKRHIFNILLSEIKTKDALKDLFYNDTVTINNNGKIESLNIPLKHRLYVIEDIDAMDSVVIKRTPEQIRKEEERKRQIEIEAEALRQSQGEAAARRMIESKDNKDEANKLDLATLLNVLDGVRETPGRIIILSTNYPERLDEALLRPGRFDMMLEFEKHSTQVLKLHLEKHYDTTLTQIQWARLNTEQMNHKWTPAEVSQILFRRVFDMDAAIDDLVKETPEKLFKYSQMTKEDSNQQGTHIDIVTQLLNDMKEEERKTSVATKSELEDSTEAKSLAIPFVYEVQSEAVNRLEAILQSEQGLASPKEDSLSISSESSESSELSDDSIVGFSGGTNCVNPDPETEQQQEAAKRVREQMAKGVHQPIDLLAYATLFVDSNPQAPNNYADMLKTTFTSSSSLDEKYHQDFLNDALEEALNSPMFGNDFLPSANTMDMGYSLDIEETGDGSAEYRDAPQATV